MAGNWWDRSYSSKSSKNYSSSDADVTDGAEDLADTVNKDSGVLKHLFMATGFLIKAGAEKMADSVDTVIEWRWPHE
jgi:hypothetical protein